MKKKFLDAAGLTFGLLGALVIALLIIALLIVIGKSIVFIWHWKV
jgi:hypothetical protein